MAEDKTFELEVVSPEKLLFSERAGMATIPGSEGEFGIFADHVPLVASLKAGVVRVYSDKGTTLARRVFIAGGFCEVTKDRVALLVEAATPVEDLDSAAVAEEIRTLEYDIEHGKDLNPVELQRLKEKLSVAQAKASALAH